MKKIINGKKYDTDTAKLIGSYSNGELYSSFGYLEKSLYKKKTGEYFLYKTGGPLSEMAIYIGNEISGSSTIIPFSNDYARRFAEKYLTVDEYEKEFGEVEE